MIDEIENGLHWKVQPKLWELIFELSNRLNIQVFAATHSADCVRAFRQLWGSHQDKGSFHRLERTADNGMRAVPYSYDTLLDPRNA